jgi:hypothetical protein
VGGEDMRREWMKRARKNIWEENNGLYHKKRRESEGSKNKDKEIVVIK